MKALFRKWFPGLILLCGWTVLAPMASAQGVNPTNGPALTAAAAEVYKLVQAGVHEEVLLAYVSKSTNSFNLNADDLIFLHTHGAPNSVTAAMLKRDQDLIQNIGTPTVPVSGTVAINPTNGVIAAANPVPIDPSKPAAMQFHAALVPYGTWFDFPQSGWAWQPFEAATNSNWRPYVDAGRWSWTDQGWYWDSDYPWGWAAFHYGRWQQVMNLGWVWFPDTVWAPSWVTWRQSDDYVGWAPLPPNALTDANVAQQPVINNYDYGVPQDSYTFVSVQYVFLSDIRSHCLPPPRVREVYPHCRVVNNYGPGKYHHGVVNRGIGIERVASATGRNLQSIPDYRNYRRTTIPTSRVSTQQASAAYALPASPRLPAAPGTRPVRTEATVLPSPNPTITPMNPVVPPVTAPPERLDPRSAYAPPSPTAPTAPSHSGSHRTMPYPRHDQPDRGDRNHAGPRYAFPPEKRLETTGDKTIPNTTIPSAAVRKVQQNSGSWAVAAPQRSDAPKSSNGGRKAKAD